MHLTHSLSFWARIVLIAGTATTVIAGTAAIEAGEDLAHGTVKTIMGTGLVMMASALAVMWREVVRMHKEATKTIKENAKAMTGLQKSIEDSRHVAERMNAAAECCEAVQRMRLRKTQQISTLGDMI